MHWHAEVTMRFEQQVGPGDWLRVVQLTLRGYRDNPNGYAEHAQFDAVGQALIHGDRAFVSGALASGQPLGRRDWVPLVLLLRDQHGVAVIVADRHDRFKAWRTDQIPSPTNGGSEFV